MKTITNWLLLWLYVFAFVFAVTVLVKIVWLAMRLGWMLIG